MKNGSNGYSLRDGFFFLSNFVVNFFSQEDFKKDISDCINEAIIFELEENQIQVDFMISNSFYYLDGDVHSSMPYLRALESLVYFFKSSGFIEADKAVNITMGSYSEDKFEGSKFIYGGRFFYNKSVCNKVEMKIDRISFIFLGENLLRPLDSCIKERLPFLSRENLLKPI